MDGLDVVQKNGNPRINRHSDCRATRSGATNHELDSEPLNLQTTNLDTMLNWWMSLGIRGTLAFWGVFGLVVNGVIFFIGLWMPILLFVSIGLLLLAMVMRGEDSTEI